MPAPALPSTEWVVTGTPAQAGAYSFTVQFTRTQDAPTGTAGPSGTQQLSITIGTGSSDRLMVTGVAYNGHQFRLYVDGYDVNLSALYSVYKTSTGKLVIAAQPNNSAQAGVAGLAPPVTDARLYRDRSTPHPQGNGGRAAGKSHLGR